MLKGEYKTHVEPKHLAYWPFRNELYVGFVNGCLSVFEVANLEKGPVCKHREAIFNRKTPQLSTKRK